MIITLSENIDYRVRCCVEIELVVSSNVTAMLIKMYRWHETINLRSSRSSDSLPVARNKLQLFFDVLSLDNI